MLAINAPWDNAYFCDDHRYQRGKTDAQCVISDIFLPHSYLLIEFRSNLYNYQRGGYSGAGAFCVHYVKVRGMYGREMQ